jgi:DNA-binding FadR family transcriptional regulator
MCSILMSFRLLSTTTRRLEVLDELAVVRESLESTMARAAATRQTPERTAALREVFDRAAANIDNISAYNDADAAFHDLVMEQSGIRLAANITRIMFERARESSRFRASPPTTQPSCRSRAPRRLRGNRRRRRRDRPRLQCVNTLRRRGHEGARRASPD